MENEFKFTTLRQFGSENFNLNVTIHSEKMVLSDEEIQEQINQIDKAVSKAFIATQEREIREKELLAIASDRRREEVAKLDLALKSEMDAKESATRTMYGSEKLSKAIEKVEFEAIKNIKSK